MPPACGNGIAGSSAQLDFPNGVAVDQAADLFIADTYDHELRWLPSGGTAVLDTGSGRLVLSAYGIVITARSLTIRYALSGPARMSVRVSRTGHPASLIARASAQPGFGELSWNLRLAGRRAAAGRYIIRLTAEEDGHATTRTVIAKV